MHRFIPFGAAAIAFGALAIAPANAVDVDNGKRLAERWCVSCHVINTSQKSATTEAPPFSAIAGKSNLDAGGLALFLLHPHPKMPDMGLSRDAASDLAAFIASQRR
jgi:mono/diheme cytochrome c family protein